MIDITYLLGGRASGSVPHRYGREADASVENPHAKARSAEGRKPIVVWNITKRCNLKCLHCYSSSDSKPGLSELTFDEAKNFLRDLARFQIPALLLSGGEPLTRPDLFEIAQDARGLGLRLVLSTNGTLITKDTARLIQSLGFSYVGISLDGPQEIHDIFRGVPGAYEKSLRAFRALVEVGQKVGLRMTLTRQNIHQLPLIFDFLEREKIRRVCFYHLVPSGRGGGVASVTCPESRRAMGLILDRTRDFIERDVPCEVLTVDGHFDGPYIFLRMLKEKHPRVTQVYDLLKFNGGGTSSSGVGIACVDWNGNVHPDQFWMHYNLGNVRERRFSEIWQDNTEPLLLGLRHRIPKLKGRCGSCRFKPLCGGALRVRAELSAKDAWAPDPSCYLTDAEIGWSPEAHPQTVEAIVPGPAL